ncbi:ATP-binding protein [Archangium violaceum]|uniref:ATP-binding protein n=1 Tax=Archangium violaceum TaxID=83451 RepID=UPI000697F394|nr:ATP-binding protein [Archangium violaceum]
MSDTASHILLVDTPPALQRHLRLALGPLGLHLNWPEAGQMVESLNRLRVAAVVLPLASEGGLSERQALRLTREAYARGVPVLLLTQELPEAVRVMAAHPVGAADVLACPPEPRVLRARVAGLVERFQAHAAQAALRESEERYRLTTLATSDAMYDWDMVTNRLHWSTHVRTLFGHPPAGIRPDFHWWARTLHREDRRRVLASLGDAIDRGAIKWREEYRFGRVDGSYADVVDQGYILRDASGRPLRMVGGMQDVTERKRAERNLRFLSEAGARLGSNLELEETLHRLAWLCVPRLADWCSVDMVGDSGRLHRMALAHPKPRKRAQACELWTRQVESASRRSLLAHVVETGRPLWTPTITPAHLAEVAGGSVEALAAFELLGAVSYILMPLKARGWVLGVLGLVMAESGRHHDETDVVLAEELANRAALAVDNALLYQRAQQAISVRDDFLSIAAHELRTPTTALKLNVQALLRRLSGDGPMPPREQLLSRLESIEQGVARQEALGGQLLDATRLSAGSLQLHREPVDLVEVVRGAMVTLAQQAEKAGCELVLVERGPVVGQWDRSRLAQVVTHLLANALKYGAGKPVRVRAVGGPDGALLSVSDRGIGIAPEHLSRIFGRFERAVSGQHYGGLGLGLYITRRIVEAMNGEVHVNSRPGRGSTFTVRLPYSPVQPQPPSHEPKQSSHEEVPDWDGSRHAH